MFNVYFENSNCVFARVLFQIFIFSLQKCLKEEFVLFPGVLRMNGELGYLSDLDKNTSFWFKVALTIQLYISTTFYIEGKQNERSSHKTKVLVIQSYITKLVLKAEE